MENQDSIDIVIQEFGSLNVMFDVEKTVVANGGKGYSDAIESFYSPELDSGSVLNLVKTEKLVDPKVVNKIKFANFVVNNAGSLIGDEPAGEGIGYWFIENDFVVQ